MKKQLLLCFVLFFSFYVGQAQVAPNTTCPMPTNITAVSNGYVITTSWVEVGFAPQWEVLVVPCGSPAPSAATSGIPTTSNPFVTTGLVPQTCYDVYVRAVCPPVDFSIWAGPATVNTQLPPPVCGSFFIDSGGPSTNYATNENQVVTICPTTPGDAVTVTFTEFDIEAENDALYVFDGADISVSQISSSNGSGYVPGGLPGGFWGTSIPGPFTSSSLNGCLTFWFRSNNSVTNSGWIANISCAPATDVINLIAFLDTNANGIQDSGELPFTQGSFVYQINDSGIDNYVVSDYGGHTIVDFNSTNSYDFSYSINSELSAYLSNASVYNNIFCALGGGIQNLYFPISIVNSYDDVAVTLFSTSAPRPGFNHFTRIACQNLGLTPTSGMITFVKDPLVSITSGLPAGTIVTANGFMYNFTNLDPGQTLNLYLTLNVPPIPTVNINDVLTNSVSVTSTANDINLNNNSHTLSEVVVGSYDPNDKMESHGGSIQFDQFDADEYLYYTIRFQNEGTAEAFTVRIEDALDDQLDETSLRMISASHTYNMQRTNQNVVWKFDDINLVPTSVNEELSKGHVTFKIKLKPGFAIGDIVPNTAEIYFDTNPAIITNTFNTEFVETLNTSEFTSDNFMIYPNPSNDAIEISVNHASEIIKEIVIYDVVGKTVQKIQAVDSNRTRISISELQSGIYLVELTTSSNLKQVKKLVIK